MSELVRTLSEGDHPVIVSLRPTPSAQALKDAIDRRYVLVKFTGTRGGTELGVSLDPAATDVSGADFGGGAGRVTLSGTLTLDYVPVRCVADIDVQTLSGTGRLEPVPQASPAQA